MLVRDRCVSRSQPQISSIASRMARVAIAARANFHVQAHSVSAVLFSTTEKPANAEQSHVGTTVASTRVPDLEVDAYELPLSRRRSPTKAAERGPTQPMNNQ